LRISGLVQTVDILPTLIDILQVTSAELGGQLQGQSLISAGGRTYPRHRYGFAEEVGYGIDTWSQKYPEFDFSPFHHELRAILTDRYKYIWASAKTNYMI
jgi:arylsulfatase A-like enzyme